MSSNTKIVVLKLKEIIFAAVIILLAAILIIMLFVIFSKDSSDDEDEATAPTYVAGVYTSSFLLSGNPIDVEVTVDNDHINSVRLVNTSEAVETMYPVVMSSIDSLASQIVQSGSIDNVTYTADSKYTCIVLMNAIEAALAKAAPAE